MSGTRSRSCSARPSDPAPTNPNLNPADAFAAHFAPQPAQEATVLPPETPINSNGDPEPAPEPATTTATAEDGASEPSQPSNDNDVGTANREEEGVSQRLLHLRQNFNRDTIRQASKAKRTFQKHESNHERFIACGFTSTSHSSSCQSSVKLSMMSTPPSTINLWCKSTLDT